jgi:hypothetical protein
MKPRGVGPIRADGENTGDIERADDLARRADLDLVSQPRPHQRVVDKQKTLAHRGPEMIAEFAGRGTRPPFRAVDDDEVGPDA